MAVQGNISRTKKPVVKERTCVLILGMHRSGTSALAGVLSKLGCELPASPMPESVNNAKGFFESVKVRDFNEELLASAGSSWDDFTPFHEGWLQSPQAPEFLDGAVTVLEEEFGDATLFVLKDPRICRLVPFWATAIERFGCRVKPVLTIRNPLEVGHSLQSKKSYSEPFSQMIWLRHVLDAEAATRGKTRFHTSFGQLMQGWETVAGKAQENLGLIWPRPVANVEFDVQKFLSKDLRHHKAELSRAVSSSLLPHWLRETYEILDRWAESGELASDHAALDRIKAEFDVASNAFGRLVRAERDNSVEYKQKIEQLETARSASEAQVQALTAASDDERKALEVRLSEEREAAAVRVAESEALRSQIEALVSQAEGQQAGYERSLEELRVAGDADREALRSELATVIADAEQEIASLKASRQEERRQKTLLNADLQQAVEAREITEARLQQTKDELSASQTRRKEASRVIARRDAEVQKRFEELAALERQILRSKPLWRIQDLLRRSFGGKAYS